MESHVVETIQHQHEEPAPPPPVDVSMTMTGYCCQFISPELNTVVADMLQRLRILQDHAPCFKPFKGEPQRWYVRGLREVRKAARQQRAKSIVMAPNIEQVEVKGGPLSTTVASILSTCKEHDIPVVFALSRKKMGDVYGCHKRMSAIAIIDTSGIEDLHAHVLQLAADLRKEWEEQYRLLQQSQEQQGSSGQPIVFKPTPLMLYTQSLMMDDACSNSSGSPSYRSASEEVSGQGSSYRVQYYGSGDPVGGGVRGAPSGYASSRFRPARGAAHPQRHDTWSRHGTSGMRPAAMIPHPAVYPPAMAAAPMLEWHYAAAPRAPGPRWHAGIPHGQMLPHPSGPPPMAAQPASQAHHPVVDMDACLANLSSLTLDTSGTPLSGVQVRFDNWERRGEASSSTMHAQLATPPMHPGRSVGTPSKQAPYPGGGEWQMQPAGAAGLRPVAISNYWQQGGGRPQQQARPSSHPNDAGGQVVVPALVPMHAGDDVPRMHMGPPAMMVPAAGPGSFYAVPAVHPVMHAPAEQMIGLGEYVVEQWPEGSMPENAGPGTPTQAPAVMMAPGAPHRHERMVYLVPHQE